MARSCRPRAYPQESVIQRLTAVRNYLRSIHAACLYGGRPLPGHVLLAEVAHGDAGLAPGGYTLVAQVGDWATLSPIIVSHRGELEYTDKLVTVRYESLSFEMVVGREAMIIPD
jgi:hypothetical protein